MHRILLTILIALIGMAGSGFAADDELAIFTMRSKPPQELVPMIAPLVGEQGSVSAYGDKLIVRAPSARLEEIRWLVSELDKPARSLLVEVRVDRHDYVEEQRMRGLVDLEEGGSSAQLRLRRAGTSGSGDIVQRVRTLDGRAARINVGQSVPVYEIDRSAGPYGGTTERFGIRYRDVTSGFYVLPRLNGEQVTLEVYQQADQPSVRTGHFDIQHASSVLRGRLGEWIPLGSIDSQGRNARDGLGLSGSTRRADQRHISVRVTPVN